MISLHNFYLCIYIKLASNTGGYALRSVNSLPPVDYVTLPKPDEHNDVYRSYQAKLP